MKTSYKIKYKASVAAGLAAIGIALCGNLTQAQISTPTVQVAGDLIVNLQSVDLSPTSTVWTNRAYFSTSVGDFSNCPLGEITFPFPSVLNVQQTPNWNGVSVSAILCTNIEGGNSQNTSPDLLGNPGNSDQGNPLNTGPVSSTLNVPAVIAGNGGLSIEEWLYSNENNNGNDYGNGYWSVNVAAGYGGSPNGDSREFAYEQQYNKSLYSWGNGNFDVGWTTVPTPGTWMYVVWTYDGLNYTAYQNGVLDVQQTLNGQFDTTATPFVVGASVQGGQLCPFNGYVAAVRVMTGVLTPDQVANNYAAGLKGTIPVYLSEPSVSPGYVVVAGDAVTLSVVATNALFPFTYQWLADNGTGGVTWTPVLHATNATFSPNTTGLAGNYGYEVQLYNAANSVTEISPPTTLLINQATPPLLVQDTTPSSITNYVNLPVTFTALFSGEYLNLQWQVGSATNGPFSNIPGQTTTNLTVANHLPGAYYYRLYATNPLGTNASHSAEFLVLATPPMTAVPVEVAGDLIVNLQSVDLSPNSSVWPNRTLSPVSVGNFTTANAASLNVPSNIPPWFEGTLVNALLVPGDADPNDAVVSALIAPGEILTNNPVSVEAWVYSLNIAGNGNSGYCGMPCVAGYGYFGATLPDSTKSSISDREFVYQNNYNGGFFSGAGDAQDSFFHAFSTTPTKGVWHYLAWTYDGAGQLNGYQDGVLDMAWYQPADGLNTVSSQISVGGAINGPCGGIDPYLGYIAAARVMSGVLTADQVANNFSAGPLGIVPFAVSGTPNLSYSYSSGSLTLTWPAGGGGSLQQATSVVGPWATVTNAPPYIVPTASAKQMFFRLTSQ